MEALGGVPAVSVTGTARDLRGWGRSGYVDVRDLPAEAVEEPVQLLAVPYFTWANRGGEGMRVWLPRSD